MDDSGSKCCVRIIRKTIAMSTALRKVLFHVLVPLVFSCAPKAQGQEAWKAASASTTQNLWSVGYGSGQFVAVGEGSTVVSSVDGVTWTARPVPLPGYWLVGVGHGAGTWVIVGDRGLILTSTNLTSWSVRTSGTTNRINGVAYGGGRWIAVCESGEPLTSVDAVTWSKLKPSGGSLRGVVYASGKFVITGIGGFVRTTIDTVDYSEAALPGRYFIESVAYASGSFVAVGEGGFSASTVDGVNWRQVATGSSARFRGIARFNNSFVAVGTDGTVMTFAEPDGAWVRRASGSTALLTSVAASDSAAVAVGFGGTVLIGTSAGTAQQLSTTLVAGASLPVSVVTGASVQFGFSAAGGSTAPAYFEFTGALPPGVVFSPSPIGNRVNSANPFIRGVPTSAGSFTVNVTAFSSAGTTSSVSHPITINVVSGVAPAIASQPSAQSGDPGVPIVFSAQVSGTPLPALQWQRMPAGGVAFSDLAPGGGYSGVNSSSLKIDSPTAEMNGDSFRLVATSPGGAVTSSAAVLTVRQAPVFTSASSASFALGVPNSFALAATGSPRPSFSVTEGSFPTWANLDPVTGVISGTPPATASGSYVFSVRASNGYTAAQVFTLSVPSWSNPLINFSGRTAVGAAGATLRFIITGGTRTVLIRAAGPSLSQFGVGGMSNPALALSDSSSGAVLATNDDWDGSIVPSMEAVRAFAFLPGSKDAALKTTLPPGSYSVLVSGVNGSSGTCVIELYDLRLPGEASEISYAGVFGGSGGGVIGGLGVSERVNLRVVLGGTSISPSVSYGEGLHNLALWGPSSIEVSRNPSDGRLVAPVLGTSPASYSPFAGYAGSLSATVISGSLPLSYQWRKAGTPIAGATQATLSFLPASTSDSGTYDVVVSNAVGTSTSPTYTVNVLAVTAPTITSQPVGGLLAIGNPARFFVQASGTQLAFQWRKDGVPIAGATGANLQFTTSSSGDAGAYDVVVSNSAGTAVSLPATISFWTIATYLSTYDQLRAFGRAGEFRCNPCGWDDGCV